MPRPIKRTFLLAGDTLLRVALVAALVFGLAYTLRQWAGRQPTVSADRAGVITLRAADATLHGPPEIRVNIFQGQRNIGWWNSDHQWMSWEVDVGPSGPYQVELTYGRPWDNAVELTLTVGDRSLAGLPPVTDARSQWNTIHLGTLDLDPGKGQIATLKTAHPTAGDVVNFVRIRLSPADSEAPSVAGSPAGP